LLMTIMGYPQYKVTGGKIFFRGTDITQMPIYKRAMLGIGTSYQRPPTIHGLKIRQIVKLCAGNDVDEHEFARRVHLEHLLDRDVNAGFSGGEIKRSELLQIMAQNPDLMLFDEAESGVDVENLFLVCNTIARLLEKDYASSSSKSLVQQKRERTKMCTTQHALEKHLALIVGNIIEDIPGMCSN